ncbi:MAG: YbaK/EbsC family protein [Firmicutes bacterium]|nr:YbaK/EbsC family protein [Bacillota bacterium]
MTEAVERVRAVLQDQGWADRVRILNDSTHTAQEAADALHVASAQIAKSIVFRASSTGRAVVVITRGDRRVHEKSLERWLGEGVERAQPDWVRASTGYPIGGVSPLGHNDRTIVILDAALWEYSHVFAAAGHPRAVFGATPDELQILTGAPMIDGISR